MYYGFVYNASDLPNDNVWTVGNELTLNDDSVVFGYEGSTEITDVSKGQTFSVQDFIVWLNDNLKPSNQNE